MHTIIAVLYKASTHAVHMLCECTGCKLQYKTHDTERNFSWLSSALTKLPGSLGHIFSKSSFRSFNMTIDFWAHVAGNMLFALSVRQCREPLHFTVYRANPDGYFWRILIESS